MDTSTLHPRAPVVCGVSSLGIDHTSILGDTMEKIAWQKGGIFKVRRPLHPALCVSGALPMVLSTPMPSARRASIHRGTTRAATGGTEGPSAGAGGELGSNGVDVGHPIVGGGSASSSPSVPSTCAQSWMTLRTTMLWSWGWQAPTSAATLPWPCS